VPRIAKHWSAIVAEEIFVLDDYSDPTDKNREIRMEI
jgi:hypothetical protein